ncbi:hypothetical protein [Terriglobus sp.]|uniref:hypothetical protein n=1 Tax=Terriglobus sp. TaxID=1889013 RepID=UPI003AFF8E18
MPPKPLPFDLLIPAPCGEDWNAMGEGGPARRHCQRCNSDVVDVSLLTGAQLRTLVERTAGNFCARVTRLPDGGMLLSEPPPSISGTASMWRAPALAGAVLAGTALPLLAQAHGAPNAHPALPAISCAEVTALKRGGGLPAEGAMAALAQAPAPAPPPQREGGAATMGKIAVPLVPVGGVVRLPRSRTVRNGLLEVYNTQRFSKSLDIKPDGSFAGALPPGKYWLRAEVRGDDGELYAAVDGITLLVKAVRHDMMLQGPVMVTAGAPAVAPTAKSGRR